MNLTPQVSREAEAISVDVFDYSGLQDILTGVIMATALLAHQVTDLGLANETDASAKHHARGLKCKSSTK